MERRSISVIISGILVAFVVSSLITVSTVEAQTPGAFDAGDFLCYTDKRPAVSINFELSDQFFEAPEPHAILEFLGFCASGDKNFPGGVSSLSPFGFEHHMMRWAIDGPGPVDSITGAAVRVELSDQFGTVEHTVFDAREIMVPAIKEILDSDGNIIQFFDPRLDVHWKCYEIDGVAFDAPITWIDQFTDPAVGPIPFDILTPSLLCTPATKTIVDSMGVLKEFPPEEDVHLKCYDVKPKIDIVTFANFRDQFGFAVISPFIPTFSEKLCTTVTKKIMSDEPTVELDHYIAYKVQETKNTPKFQKINVELLDQFDDPAVVNTYKVRMPVALYNPTIKVHDGTVTDIIDNDTHFVGYSFIGPQKQVTNILVENQFGEITVDTIRADLLLVPSLKNPDHLVDTTLPLPITVDHFKCYKIEVTLGTPGFMPQQVLLADQFLDREFTVVKPTRLCNPVEKTVFDATGLPSVITPINNPDNHLMCYKLEEIADIKPQKFNVWTDNQFGPEALDVKKPKELCVPSIKTVL